MRRYAARMGFEEKNLDDIVAYILERVSRKMPVSEVIKEIRNNE